VAKDDQHVDIGGRQLVVRNLQKVMYPATGFTKAEVIDYYARVAPVMLPHLAGRPVTRRRFPDGEDGASFFEKNCPSHRPDWVPTAEIDDVSYCRIEEPAAMVWLANLAALELHVPMGLADSITHPRAIVFDLDPGPGVDAAGCARVAVRIREVLDALGLECWPKTSGSKGLQVYAPINTPTSYDDTTPFAHGVAKLLEQEDPKFVTSVMRKDLRKGKVFVDWSQNTTHKTTVCVYSLRAVERPRVSTPVQWDEVEAAAEAGDATLLEFEAVDVLARVDEHGDLFAPVLDLEQVLPDFG
jgi:bifunctional non-homologous end joining protein LigD